MPQLWYRTAYRRNVIDMHITEEDPSFLSQFDTRNYVDMLRLCQAQSAVVYAHSHVGYCYYPSQVGHMHAGLHGRDILGEVITQCHAQDIAVVVYYSLIYDDWAYRQHPDWRIVLANGEGAAEHSRYGVCCPNSPYRDYARAHAEEICRLFTFEGLRFDMTFWPAVCYCPHCQRRYAAEVGGELPRIVDWSDPRWVSFQRCREAWLSEFALYITSAVKLLQPEVSVEHQASTYPLGWRFGVTGSLVPANDFLQGDFYGDALQGSFVRKLFTNLSPALPYGFETSSAVSLQNHTAIKPAELLRAKAAACLADNAAFIFIDAIDPLGTLNRRVYERMGRVFDEVKVYDHFRGGTLCQDVGVYLSLESKFDPADNGKAVDDPRLSTRTPHVDAVVSVCRALIAQHIPFGVVTRRNLRDLLRHRVIVLPNVLMLNAEEAAALRDYVRAGGCLYASKTTSLVTPDGARQPNFLLADVFGVSYRGETRDGFTYVAPAEGQEELFAGYTAQYPLGVPTPQIIVEAQADAAVLARVALPYTDPADPRRYASIHSNPPGVPTVYPAVVQHAFGQGKAMYASADLESHDIHHETFVALLRRLAGRFSCEADAPQAVEVTLFHQTDLRRYLINLVNFQKDLPNVPVEGVTVRVRLERSTPSRLLYLPDERPWPYQLRDGYVEFVALRLDTFAMFALDYV